MRWIQPGKLTTDPDLASVFPIRDSDLAAVAQSMRERGYDQAEPIVVWDGEGIIVDGHTRLAAARHARIERVYVDERTFSDKREALEYCIRRQRDRRNLTHAELAGFVARAMAALDRVKTAGRPSKELASIDANSGKSAAVTAAAIGVSTKQVERVRAVLASENFAIKAQLHAGQSTINASFAA